MNAITLLHTNNKDLNLLLIFAALLEERNVSRAAKRLGLSQPALSHALARLRRDFADDLFVRSGKGVAPTARALSLESDVLAAVAQVERLFATGRAFRPLQAQGAFVIATTDDIEQLLLPRLLPFLRRTAPGIVPIVRSTEGRLPTRALETGAVDLAAAGFFGEPPEGFYRQRLFDETYTCVVRHGHPLVGATLDLATFVALDHLLVSPQGDLAGAIDKALASQGLQRRVVAGVSTFQTPAAIVTTTDCIATLPSRLAREYARHYPIRCFPPPLPVPGFRVEQVWHARSQRDPQHAWMRRAIEALLNDQEPPES